MRSKILQDILDSITPERQAEIDAQMEAMRKFYEEHPDYNERYGTDKSYWLESVIKAGFNPIAITAMVCEETLIFETPEETEAAAKAFLPEGWYYTITEWEKARKDYIDKFYNGDEACAPEVFCLNDKFKKYFI